MRFVFAVLMMFSLGLPAMAQEPQGGGRSDMERGVELFFRGLRDELGPALGDLEALARQAGPAMRSFIREMGPALGEIFAEVKDWSRYEPPEILPNGDIIIRRKPDPVPDPVPEAEPEPPESGEPDQPIDL